jgi:hypothetical protein
MTGVDVRGSKVRADTWAFSPRSSDPSRAVREEFMTLASLSAGVRAATNRVVHGRELSKSDRFALTQAAAYFKQRAADLRKGPSLSNIASMSAAREIADLVPPVREGSGRAEKIYRMIGKQLDQLVADPSNVELATLTRAIFEGLAENLRASARSLAYEDQDAVTTLS